MRDYRNNNYQSLEDIETEERNFINKVFLWVSAGIALTGISIDFFATTITRYIFNFLRKNLSPDAAVYPILILIFISIPFLILVINFDFKKWTKEHLVTSFFLYSLIMGFFVSIFCFLSSSPPKVTFALVFYANICFVCSSTFGIMALLGFLTKINLTSIPSLLCMAIIGIIIAAIIIFSLKGNINEYLFSVIFIMWLTLVTAIDRKILKAVSSGSGEYEGIEENKKTIVGALTLCLDFIKKLPRSRSIK